MSQPLPAVVAGHICVDFIPNMDSIPPGKFAELFQPGRLINVGPAAFSTGGPVSNTGLSLSRLGVPTRLVAKVGSDPFAQIVRGIVDSYGPHLSEGILSSSAATSYTVITNPPGVDRIFMHHTGANDTFGAEDVPYDMLAQSALFHFGYPQLMARMYAGQGRELVEILRRAKDTGVTTSLDMTFPDPSAPAGQADWVEILHAALPYVDVFLPSIEETLFCLRRSQYEQLMRQARGEDIIPLVTPDLLTDLSDELLGCGVKILMLKLSYRGAYLRTAPAGRVASIGRAAPPDSHTWAERELWAPCFQVDVAGTTGAGDATIAGFLAAMLRGRSAEEALTAAVAAGACNVEAPDALSGVRTWEDTLTRIASGWPRRELQIDSPDWSWDAASNLWRK